MVNAATSRRIVLTTLGILVAVFAMTVWPTRYRYDQVRGVPVRTNRFTGSVERLSTSGWYAPSTAAPEPESRDSRTAVELTPADLSLVEVTEANHFIEELSVDVFNGSDKYLDSVTLARLARLPPETTIQREARDAAVERRAAWQAIAAAHSSDTQRESPEAADATSFAVPRRGDHEATARAVLAVKDAFSGEPADRGRVEAARAIRVLDGTIAAWDRKDTEIATLARAIWREYWQRRLTATSTADSPYWAIDVIHVDIPPKRAEHVTGKIGPLHPSLNGEVVMFAIGASSPAEGR